MLELVGLLSLSAIGGYLAFIVSARLIEHFGFWRKDGLGGVIPMLIIAALIGLGTASLIFSIL